MSSSNMTRASSDQLKTSLENFEAVLTHDQKHRLQRIAAVPDAPAVIAFTTQLDNENAKRGSRCVATRLLTFLQSIQQFTTVVDTFVSSNPAIPALVWGSVKLAVLLTSNNASYFEKLSALLMNFSKHCPRYSEYQVLYADSVGLRNAVCNFYAVVIDCCTQAVQVISKSEEPRAFWRPFKTDELGRFETEIRECKSEVDAEIYRALHQTIFQEQQLTAQHRDLGSIFRARVDKSNEEGKKWRIQTDERQARFRKQELLERLSNYDYMTPFRRASMKRHGQTASWLTKSIDFGNWMAEPKSSVFILSGKLGSGKTVTTACTISHLFEKSGNNYRVIYFFCQFDRAESLSASIILSSLVRQLLDTKTLSKSIEASVENLLKVPCPEAQELGILLKDVLVITKCNFIFIDAIDECSKPEWEVLLDVLRDIVVSCSSVVKVFLAVRQGIAEEVGNAFACHYQATMDSSEANADIRTYIQNVLAEKVDRKKLVVGNPELVNEITDVLVQEANGMLVCHTKLLLRVLMEIGFFGLLSKLKIYAARSVTATFAKQFETSQKIYQKPTIASCQELRNWGIGNLPKKIFPWVATARRPLLLEELKEALSIEPLQPYSDPEGLVNDMSQIVSWCGNLIVLDEQDGTVQFTHQTVKMFLLHSFWDQTNSDFHLKQREIDLYAGEICVTYLNFNDFKTKLIRQPKELRLPNPETILRPSLSVGSTSTSQLIWKTVARLRGHHKGDSVNPIPLFTGDVLHSDLGVVRELEREHPFISYAAKYWLYHTANFEREKAQIWRLWERLFSDNGPAEMPWKDSEWSQRTGTIRRWICDQEHAALLSVIELSKTPFSEAEMLSIMNFAIERPSFDLFDTVLRKRDSSTTLLNESLIIAVGGGHLWATDKLIAEEANPNCRGLGFKYAKKFEGLTALQVAANGGYLEVVGRLLTAKADVNAEPSESYGRTALQAAAGAGHVEIVERLLIAKADVNAIGAQLSGRTALQAAAGAGSLEVVERLLTAKADVNAKAATYYGRTALQAAAGAGSLEVVERLLIAKADVNAKGAQYSGLTALQAAAEAGHLAVVERLLIAKADVNAEAAFQDGLTALQAAAGAGHLEVVERLLIAKADVNAEAAVEDGLTALQAAAGAGHLEVVERLLIAKADVNAKGDQYSDLTALQAAAEAGHLEVVERLLIAKAGLADVNAKAVTEDDIRALELAAGAGHLEVVERLLIAMADMNAEAVMDYGLTALQLAAGEGHLEVVERLLIAKADVVHAKGAQFSDRTALQAAVEGGHLEVVERLLREKVAKKDVRAILKGVKEEGDARIIKVLKSAVLK